MELLRLFGNYESLEAGKAKDALVDMMGGVAEGVDLTEYKDKEQKDRDKLFKDMVESFENHSLMSASIAVGILYTSVSNSSGIAIIILP